MNLLPSELWEQVCRHIPDPLDLYALWQVFPESVAGTVYGQPDRLWPWKWRACPELRDVVHHCNFRFSNTERFSILSTMGEENDGSLWAWLDASMPASLNLSNVESLPPADPRVQALHLREFDGRSLPTTIGAFRNLRELTLSGQMLTPEFIAQMITPLPRLELLDISSNRFKSWDEVCEWLPADQLRGIRALGLGVLGAGGTDPASVERLLRACPKLLRLQANFTTWLPGSWVALTQDRIWDELSVCGSRWSPISDPAAPIRIRARTFHVGYIHSKAMEDWIPCPETMRAVRFEYCHQIPEKWLRLLREVPLVQLSFRGCPQIECEDLAWAAATLEELHIDYTTVRTLPPMPRLETLSCMGTFLDDAALARCPALRRVQVGVQRTWTHAVLAEWIRARPWHRHVWFMTRAAAEEMMAVFPECIGSAHTGPMPLPHGTHLGAGSIDRDMYA